MDIGAPDAPAVSELIDAVETVVTTNAGDEETIRALLTEMARITGSDPTHLTQIHPARSVHEIRYARNSGELDIREGLLIDRTDSLCRAGMVSGPRAGRCSQTVAKVSDGGRIVRKRPHCVFELAKWRPRPVCAQ